MVFQHFDFKDFVQVTEVSPNWSEIIGQSLVMMRNVKLNMEVLFRILDENPLKNFRSNRRYQNVFVGFLIHVPSDDQFRRLLEFLVELGPLMSLKLRCVCMLSVQKENLLLDKIDSSKMKVLELRFVAEDLCFVNELLNRCNSLTKINLTCAAKRGEFPINPQQVLTPPSSIPSLIPFLERNQNLQELSLVGFEFYQLFFSNDISEIVRFKLKHLLIFGYTSQLTEGTELNLLKFLVKQSQTLESLELETGQPDLIEHAFNKMPALTLLHCYFEFSADRLQLNRNENILEFGMFSTQNSEDFEKIIKFTPKVTGLSVLDLTAEKIEIISRNLPTLQRLQFETCERVNNKPVWTLLWPHRKTI